MEISEELFFRIWRNKPLKAYIFGCFNRFKLVNFYKLDVYTIHKRQRLDLLWEMLRLHRLSHSPSHFKNGISEDSINHRIDINNITIYQILHLCAKPSDETQKTIISKEEVFMFFIEFYKEFEMEFNWYLNNDISSSVITFVMSLDTGFIDILIPNKTEMFNVWYGRFQKSFYPIVLKCENVYLIQYLFETDDPIINYIRLGLKTFLFEKKSDGKFVLSLLPVINDTVFMYLFRQFSKEFTNEELYQRFYTESRFQRLYDHGHLTVLKFLIEEQSQIYNDDLTALPKVNYIINRSSIESFRYLVKFYPLSTSEIRYFELLRDALFEQAEEITSQYKDYLFPLYPKSIYFSTPNLVTVDNLTKLKNMVSIDKIDLDYNLVLALKADNLELIKYIVNLTDVNAITVNEINVFIYPLSYQTLEYLWTFVKCKFSPWPSAHGALNLHDKSIQKLILSALDDSNHINHSNINVNEKNYKYILVYEYIPFLKLLIERGFNVVSKFRVNELITLPNSQSIDFILKTVDFNQPISFKDLPVSEYTGLVRKNNIQMVTRIQSIFFKGEKIFSDVTYRYDHRITSSISSEMFSLTVSFNPRDFLFVKNLVAHCVIGNNIGMLQHLYEKYPIMKSNRFNGIIITPYTIELGLTRGYYKLLEYLVLVNHPMLIFNFIFRTTDTILKKNRQPIIRLVKIVFSSLNDKDKLLIFFYVARKSINYCLFNLLDIFEDVIQYQPDFKEFQKPKYYTIKQTKITQKHSLYLNSFLQLFQKKI
ncbi:hypothetical protein DLAC_01574 [Tieghemostelium lacteum]|uniref:Uncharacterized protein n=1 Tax=Tieghemostelium lacteum TaxID=361077 RepID=A0A152A5R8_TIELA|nr:hypothetical protein DLAC_01574 [Tieghemostelium lacteum]|eukprot:KYR01576.1 hypothetical protein DLAC_01574 [Tieghemostelium lacteum]